MRDIDQELPRSEQLNIILDIALMKDCEVSLMSDPHSNVQSAHIQNKLGCAYIFLCDYDNAPLPDDKRYLRMTHAEWCLNGDGYFLIIVDSSMKSMLNKLADAGFIS